MPNSNLIAYLLTSCGITQPNPSAACMEQLLAVWAEGVGWRDLSEIANVRDD